MKKIILLIALVFSLSHISFAQSNKWITYNCKEGHYSISFPGTPKEEVEYDSSGVDKIKINLATYEVNDNTVLMSGWIDMNGTAATDKSIKQLLEDSRDGATNAMKVTDVVTTATVLTGEPYIEFTFKSGDFTGKDRIYYINGVQYSLVTIFALDKGIGPEADKFIGSFKHTKG